MASSAGTDIDDEEWNDPPMTDQGWPRIAWVVLAAHAVGAMLALGIGVVGLQGGEPIQFLLFGAMSVMLLIAGVAAGRIASRKY